MQGKKKKLLRKVFSFLPATNIHFYNQLYFFRDAAVVRALAMIDSSVV